MYQVNDEELENADKLNAKQTGTTTTGRYVHPYARGDRTALGNIDLNIIFNIVINMLNYSRVINTFSSFLCTKCVKNSYTSFFNHKNFITLKIRNFYMNLEP